MSKNSNRIRTDIAVVRPAGSKGEMYDLEFLGQQNTQNLIDATVQRIQNKKNEVGEILCRNKNRL